MARPSKHDGAVYKRNDGKILWITYRDRNGTRIRESTFTEDWQEAQRKLRERLQARDDKLLEIVRKGEQLQFLRMGRLFSGKLFPAAPACRKDARGQLARRIALEKSLRTEERGRDLGGRRRVLSAPASGIECASKPVPVSSIAGS